MAASRTNFSNPDAGTVPGLGQKYRHLQTKIKELYLADVKEDGSRGAISRVARKVDAPYHSVFTFLTETGIHEVNPRLSERSKKAQRRPDREPPTLETISAEERELRAKQQEIEAQLADIEHKRQAYIEVHSLKITHTVDHNGVILRKEGNVLVLSYDDAYDMVDKLQAFLVAIPSKAEGATP
jgi:hypothetical protein